MRRIISCCLTILIFGIQTQLLLAQPVPSREPSSTHIFPAGGQRGQTVKVNVGAECIPPGTGFRITGMGVSAPSILGGKVYPSYEPSPRRQPTEIPISYPTEWEHQVVIDPGADLGVAIWQLTCARGGTGGRPFVIGELPELIESEPNSTIDRAESVVLPVTVNGQISGERDLDYYSVPLKSGQLVTCDLAAQRIGSLLDPLLEVYDPEGQRLRVHQIRRGSDPVVVFRATETGNYRIMVCNVSFHGGPHYVYRLTLSEKPYTAFAFPTGWSSGETREFQFYTMTGSSDGTRFNTETKQLFLGPVASDSISEAERVFQSRGLTLHRGEYEEVIETEPNDQSDSAMLLKGPITVHGQFQVRNDNDWYAVKMGKGQQFYVEGSGYPTGGPAKVQVEIIDPHGRTLSKVNSVESDNGKIQVAWTAAEDGVFYARVHDLQFGKGGLDYIYRLSFLPGKGDFSLSVPHDYSNLLQDSKTEIEVTLHRKGMFRGVVDLEAVNLPDGVRFEPTQFATNENTKKLVLVADENTRSAGYMIQIHGRANVDGEITNRIAMAKHFGSDDEGVGLGITESRLIHLTVAHRPVFRLYCNEAYQYAYRGTVHHYLMEVERLNGFEGPIVLQAGDRQNRDLDGVQIQQIIVDPGQTQVGVPIYFPESMHINVQSLSQLYTQGYAIFEGQHGEKQATLVVSEKRNLVRTLPPVVKLKSGHDGVPFMPGQMTRLQLELERTSNFTGEMEIQLLDSDEQYGISIDPVHFEVGQNKVHVNVRFSANARVRPQSSLRLRGHGVLYEDIPVISETSIPITKVAEQ